MSATTETLKRTPLHERHVDAGARMVPFAGWDMPVQYEGIKAEHLSLLKVASREDLDELLTDLLCHVYRTKDAQNS